MALRFPCPTCNRELSGPESITGSEVQCPACHTVFVAGAPRGAQATGIAAERQARAAPPVPNVDNPYRNSLPDEDRPRRPVDAPQERVGRWFGLAALLVFAPLAFIGIVAWMLIGRSSPTTMPVPVARPAATTTKTDKWVGDKPRKWQTFKIPNTSSTVSLPGAPDTEPQRKVDGSFVERYTSEDGERNLYVVATIRIPNGDQALDGLLRDKISDWLLEQITAKLHYDPARFRDVTVVKTTGGAVGYQWRLDKDRKAGDTSVLQVYLSHDGMDLAIQVFEVVDLFGFRELDRGVEFFNSIQIGGNSLEEKN
jgi:hypothetical protein